MLMVPTFIGPSEIHGLGLFAAELIPKGTVIWKFSKEFDMVVEKKELELLSEIGKKQFLHYCYLSSENNKYVLCFDDSRFVNHSDNPNTIDDPTQEGELLSRVDIQRGEEITCDYRIFDADFRRKLGL